jgi:hypothetical protein
MRDPLACVKLLNAGIPAIFAASNIPNGRVFRGITKRRTTIRIRVLFCVANTNGLALTSIGLTLRTVIPMSTATTYFESLQGPVAAPQFSEEIYYNTFTVLVPLNPTNGVGPNPSCVQ